MRRLGAWRVPIALALVIAVAVVAMLALVNRDDRDARGRVQASLAVAGALDAGDVDGFARAIAPRDLVFPADHGPHPEFRTEWWYYTGHLTAAGGRHFGFQLTFFRTALVPPASAARPAARASAWASDQVYLAHFALTDTRGARFRAWSRTSREALGLAGAQTEPFRVWLEDWSVSSEEPTGLPMTLQAVEADVAVTITLDSAKPPVLHGDRGLSRKGPKPGNASLYYSLTRMPARGEVRVAGETFHVTGLAWMDREWSTSALGTNLVGWDWLALQLDDGRDLMFYRLRRRDGTADPFSAGSIVDERGAARALSGDDVRMEAVGTWTSPASRVRYPSGWRLILPREDLTLEITPRLADQELRVGTRYWEGAVTVLGKAAGRPITGQGYVELVGYGE
jgi:predicted secreted hydrolase